MPAGTSQPLLGVLLGHSNGIAHLGHRGGLALRNTGLATTLAIQHLHARTHIARSAIKRNSQSVNTMDIELMT